MLNLHNKELKFILMLIFYFRFSLSVKIEMSYIMAIIFWDILMFDQVFLSPQVKRSLIISNKHGIYELPIDLKVH